MKSLRRAAVAAVCFTLGAAVVASPGWAAAEPSTQDRPDVVNSAGDARSSQTVAKDAEGRTLVYVEGPQESALRAAVTRAGGVVADADAGRVKAAVAGDKLDEVAKQAGVTEVRLPDRAVPMAVTSEGVGLSKANLWIQDGKKGAGVKVGIIDVGFGGVADAQDAGELPTGAGLTVNNANCLDGSVKTPHGTAVAEIVHDMAPDASLYLACIEDTVSFSAAADWLRQQGVQVITAAVGFLSPTGGRGDGSGPADSPADVVKRSRDAGILWTVAAGNQARLHFAGNAVDRNGDSWVEFNGETQNNGFPLDAGRSATVGLRWDAWPKTNEDLDLYVMGAPHPPTGPNDPDIRAVSTRSQKDTSGGLSPTEEVTFTNNADPAVTRSFYVYAKNNGARFTTGFELFVGGPSGQLQFYTEAGSVTEPATSPYAMAVGATAPNSGVVESYSGRGPTIDGRVKPDITGFDKVSTSSVGPLAGTSAAAAHVAGAAALLKSANPQLDAAQLQSALQSKASPKKADNTWGNGTLSLGTPDTVPMVTGSGFTVAPSQERIHSQPYTAGQVVTLPFPSVPGDTTAVALSLSARSDVETTIDLFPGDPATSTSKATGLRVRGGNTFTSLTVFVPLGADRGIRIRNKSGNAWLVAEFLGYFSPSQSTDTYFAKPSAERVLDTRGLAGSPRGTPLKSTDVQDVPIRGVAGVPSNATSVVVNLTGFEASRESFVLAYGANNPGTTSLALSAGDRRSALAVVPIAEDGKIRIKNQDTGGGAVGVAVDVVGWFGPGAGARYVTLPEAARIADTATGTGLPKAPVGQGTSATVQVSGIAGVSASATTAALTVTGVDDNLGTDLSVRATEVGWSRYTDISTRKLEPSAGLVLSPLGESGKVDVRNDRGQARVAVDVSGYFVGGTKVTSAVAGNCVTAKDAPGFSSAFDGRLESDLSGWLTSGAKRIKTDGCELVTDTGSDLTWYTGHTYANDYTLKLDFKSTTDNSDSGVFVLFVNPGNDPARASGSGYEIQIGPKNATGALQTGGIVGLRAPSTTAPVKPAGEWNTYELTVRWNTVTVTLNGQKVNEYTSADATQVGRNTYIGLQNNGANDPVRFRNVRVKRDTAVTSGAFVGVNNRCLDIFNGDPHQSVLHMWPCHGGFAQVWSANGDGPILAGGRCLTSKDFGTANGTSVVLAGCAGNQSQEWVQRQDGRLINVLSGRCLTPISGDQGSQLQIQNCDSQRSDQVWRTPDQRGKSGKVVGPGGRCLDVYDNNPLNIRLGIWDCMGSVAQSWVITGDGSLRADGKCADVANASTAEGAAVNLWECNGHQAQQWVAQPDGTLVNPVSGRCLTSASTDNGAALSINNCTASDRQMWRMSAETLSRGSVVGIGGKCLDVYGNDPNSSRLWLWDCYGPGGQLWWAPGDGTMRAYGKCMDIGNTANLTDVVLMPCNGGESQQWVARPNGLLANALSGRCVDDYFARTDNGTAMVLYDCHGDINQRWSTPAKAS